MNNLTKYMLTLSLFFISSLAFAHEGHDHQHWSSTALHVAFYMSLVAVVVTTAFAAKKYYQSRQR